MPPPALLPLWATQLALWWWETAAVWWQSSLPVCQTSSLMDDAVWAIILWPASCPNCRVFYFPYTPLPDEASAGCCHTNEIVSLWAERGSSLFLFFLQHRLLNDRPHGNAGLISGCRLGEVTDGAQPSVWDLSSSWQQQRREMRVEKCRVVDGHRGGRRLGSLKDPPH